MKRFVLFKNSKAIASFDDERVARFRFLRECFSCNFRRDFVLLVDIENDGETIAEF